MALSPTSDNVGDAPGLARGHTSGQVGCPSWRMAGALRSLSTSVALPELLLAGLDVGRPPPKGSRPLAARYRMRARTSVAQYTTILLDLDDTLYPSSTGLWKAISQRIDSFMQDVLGIAPSEAILLRADYLRRYGTTLGGLVAHHNADPLNYLLYVHDIDLDGFLAPNPELGSMLAQLPQKRVVFTNATKDHADRVLRRLSVERHIDRIVDILALEFHNKPRPEAYGRAMSLVGDSNPQSYVILDDRVENLDPARSMGMTTVLVGSDGGRSIGHIRIAEVTDLLAAVPRLVEEV